MSDLEINVYRLIDSTLQKLQNGQGEIEFSVYNTEGKNALDIIKSHRLISFANPANIVESIAHITLEGQKVIDQGGIKEYLNAIAEKKEQKENKEQLEIKKLKADFNLLEKQLSDYKYNKRLTLLGFLISLIALAISIFK